MEELSLDDLDARFRKHVAASSQGIEAQRCIYAVEVCRSILEQHPGCAEVRRILYEAQQNACRKRNWVFKVWNRILFCFYGAKVCLLVGQKRFFILEKMVMAWPTSRMALRRLGQVASELNLWQTAVVTYECLRSLSSDDDRDIILLGEAYIATGQNEAAIKLGETILSKDPGNSDALTMVQRASIAYTLGRKDAA